MNPNDPPFVVVTNRDVYDELRAARRDIQTLSATIADYPETKKRVRGLELKFYGILAGLVGGAAFALLKSAGVPL